MQNWKTILLLIALFYFIISLLGIIANKTFDINDYNGEWSGTRNIRFFGKGSHTQYHYLELINGQFVHSVQHPINGRLEVISTGQLIKTMTNQILPGFQKDVDFKIVSIERNDYDSISSFCVVRVGAEAEECDIRFRRK